MCVPDFPIKGFSSSAKKRERPYVGEFMTLTIGLGYVPKSYLSYLPWSVPKY